MKPRAGDLALDETGTDALLLLSDSGTILEANARACELLGREQGELLGAGQDEVLDPSDPRLGAAMEELGRTGRFAGPLRFLKGDGGSFSAGTEMAVLPDEPGRIHVSFRPARTEDVDREVLFRLVVQNASDIVSIYDFPDARLRYISPAVERILGYTPEEAIARGGVGGPQRRFTPTTFPR